MARHLLLGMLAFALIGFDAVGLEARPNEPKATTPRDPHFTGKVIFVQTKTQAVTLEKPQVKRLGDRSFIVGSVIKDEVITRGGFAGAIIWLPLSEVLQMVEYDDLDQLKKVTGSAR